MEQIFWLNRDGLKFFLTMNSLENQITKMNTTLENMAYLANNKNILSQHIIAPINSWKRKMDTRNNV